MVGLWTSKQIRDVTREEWLRSSRRAAGIRSAPYRCSSMQQPLSVQHGDPMLPPARPFIPAGELLGARFCVSLRLLSGREQRLSNRARGGQSGGRERRRTEEGWRWTTRVDVHAEASVSHILKHHLNAVLPNAAHAEALWHHLWRISSAYLCDCSSAFKHIVKVSLFAFLVFNVTSAATSEATLCIWKLLLNNAQTAISNVVPQNQIKPDIGSGYRLNSRYIFGPLTDIFRLY